MDDPRIKTLAFIEEKILRATYTKPQLIRRIRVLKDFLSFSLYEHPESRQNPLQKQVDDYLALQQLAHSADSSHFREREWLISLGQDFYNQITPALFTELCENFEKSLKNIQDFVLYIPTELPEKEQFLIGEWFKNNIDPKLIFEIRIDPDLVGGCVLSYKGMYRDYSLRSTLAQSRQVILDNLRAFKK
jgi:hypothetical protein